MENKFPLKAEQDLKLYVFQVLPKGVQISLPADYISCVSFNLENAAGSVLNQYKAKNLDVSLNQCVMLPVSAILSMLKLPEAELPQSHPLLEQSEVKEQPKPENTKEEFINGLKLVVDKYIKNKEERTLVRGILAKVENAPEKKPSRKGGKKGS